MRHHQGFVAYTCKLPKGSGNFGEDKSFAVQPQILPICGKIPFEKFKLAIEQLYSR
jgi:hypothetical protein